MQGLNPSFMISANCQENALSTGSEGTILGKGNTSSIRFMMARDCPRILPSENRIKGTWFMELHFCALCSPHCKFISVKTSIQSFKGQSDFDSPCTGTYPVSKHIPWQFRHHSTTFWVIAPNKLSPLPSSISIRRLSPASM